MRPAPTTTLLLSLLVSVSLSVAADGPGSPPDRLPSAGGIAPGSGPSTAARPNVLFIPVDDLRPDLGAYGNLRAKTPHLDRLAREGVVFERAYCQQAVCSPSRTSLLTGLRPDSTRVYDLETHFRHTVPRVVTLPQHFKDHGYETVGLGKIYHGGLDDPRSWSVPHRGPKARMYQLPENLRLIAEKKARLEKEGVAKQAISRRARGPAFEAADVADDAYPDGELAEMGVAALRDLAAKGKPFFLAVGFLKPHLPFNAPKRYWDLHDRSGIRLPENGSAPRNAPSFALTDFGELRSYDAIPARGAVPEETARSLIHGYHACVSYVDAQIGRLLAELERLGLRKDTVVIVWGDHGWKLGEHGSWCKHTNFELDTRSTLIVSAPAAAGNGRGTRALVEFVDIYPTLCELAGLPLPDHIEGRSFAPLLADPVREWKRAAFSQYPRGKVMGHSMRTDRYRLTLWRESAPGRRTAAVELYDHVEDPGENVNIADDPRNAELLERLTTWLEAGWKETLPPGR